MERRSFLSGLGTAFAAALFGKILDAGTIEAAAENWQWGADWQWGAAATAGALPTVITAAELSTRMHRLLDDYIIDNNTTVTGHSWLLPSQGYVGNAGKPKHITRVVTFQPEMHSLDLNQIEETVLKDAMEGMFADLGLVRSVNPHGLLFTDTRPNVDTALEANAGGLWSTRQTVKVNGEERVITLTHEAVLSGPILHVTEKKDGSMGNSVFEFSMTAQTDNYADVEPLNPRTIFLNRQIEYARAVRKFRNENPGQPLPHPDILLSGSHYMDVRARDVEKIMAANAELLKLRRIWLTSSPNPCCA